MDLLDHVAAKIKDLRVSYNSGEGLSQESLAAHLKVAPNTISRWETGTYRPSLKDLERILYFENYVVVEPGLSPLKQFDLLTEEQLYRAQEEYGDDAFVAKIGAEGITNTPQEFRAMMERDIAKFAPLVKASGARID